MSIAVTERMTSRELSVSGDKRTLKRHFIVDGTHDETDAETALLNAIEAIYNGLVRDSYSIDPVNPDTVTETGLWEASATYKSPTYAEPETGDSSFSFDTGGGSQHITQSLSTIGRYAASGTAPDFKGAINVTETSVDGVDIITPVYKFSETHYLADAAVTSGYKGTLFNLTGKVNSGSFKGFAGGEVLFEGASGAKRGEDQWEITFKFAASPNRTNISIGEITVPAKKGWEYLWVQYADDEDTAAKALVKKPVAAYVEKVYEEASFAGLGI